MLFIWILLPKMLGKYDFCLFVCFLCIANCDESNKKPNSGLDALSNQLKNRFCKNDFTIRFKVRTGG